VDLFSTQQSEQAVYLVYDGDKNGNGEVDVNELDIRPLKGDGDFRSKECIALLEQADIVVTNPPFSLFREYVAQLMKYQKKFLIIGNVGAIGYTEIFPLFKNNQLWLGQSIHSGDREFQVPQTYPLNAAGNRVDEHGNKFIRVKGVRWFTNLDYSARHEPMTLYRIYRKEDYPFYENYDAIDVNKTSDIPCDYYDIMGVPITFVDYYCPDQFEIIGNPQGDSGKELGLRPYNRELKKLNPSLRDGQLFYMKDGRPIKPFTRILIRRKQ